MVGAECFELFEPGFEPYPQPRHRSFGIHLSIQVRSELLHRLPIQAVNRLPLQPANVHAAKDPPRSEAKSRWRAAAVPLASYRTVSVRGAGGWMIWGRV